MNLPADVASFMSPCVFVKVLRSHPHAKECRRSASLHPPAFPPQLLFLTLVARLHAGFIAAHETTSSPVRYSLSSLNEYKKVDGRNPPAKARLINLSSRATLFAAGPSSVARVLGIRIQCGTRAVPLAHSSVLPCGKSPDCFCDDYSLGLLGSASIRTIEISATPGGRKETHENHHIMCI